MGARTTRNTTNLSTLIQQETALAKRLGPDVGLQIVLVHGIGVGFRYYAPLARVLARSAGVHVLELPGFGGAPKPESPLSVEELAAVVNAYVRAAGLDEPVLVGHSMGAQVVVDAVLQDPGLVPVVVVMGCVVDPRWRTALQQGLRLLQDCLRETWSANWTVLREYARTGPRWYLRTVPSMLGYRTEEAVARLPVPLLIVRDATCREQPKVLFGNAFGQTVAVLASVCLRSCWLCSRGSRCRHGEVFHA